MATITLQNYQFKEIYSDIEMDLTKQTDGDVLRDVDVEAIKNSLINIVKTIPGQRRMLPDFAIGPADLLFQPIDDDTAYKLGHHIIDNITIWDDRIVINQVIVKPNPDYNRYGVLLDFYLRAMGPLRTYTVDFVLQLI